MQRYGNGDGNGRDLSRNQGNGHAQEIRRRAQQRAQQRLQRLYRLKAAQEYRDRSGSSPRLRTPLMIGSGLLVAMIGVGFLGIFILLQGAATGYAVGDSGACGPKANVEAVRRNVYSMRLAFAEERPTRER